MEKASGDNWSYRTNKAPVKSSPPKKPTPSFLQAGFLSEGAKFYGKNQPKILQKKISPNNSVAEPKEKSQPYDIHEQKTNEQLIVKRCVQAYFSLLISNVHGSTSCHFFIL